MTRSLICILITTCFVLSTHYNAKSSGSWSKRKDLEYVRNFSRKIRSPGELDDKKKRAVALFIMTQFINQNLVGGNLPFDEVAQRGKMVYTRFASGFDEMKIADVLDDVPKSRIKLLIGTLEDQKWISSSDKTELELNINGSGTFQRSLYNQNSGGFILGLISYIDVSTERTEKKGTIAYAFQKIRLVNRQVQGNEFQDLMAYLGTAVQHYYHEMNGPTFLRLKAEQVASWDDLPDQLKRDIQQIDNDPMRNPDQIVVAT